MRLTGSGPRTLNAGGTAGRSAAERAAGRAPRLCLLIHSYAPETTPPQRRWDAFVRAFVEAGWNVDVIAPTVPGREDGRTGTGAHGERIVRTPAPRSGAGGRNSRFLASAVHAVLCLPAALTVPRPDVVVATLPALPMVVPARVLRLLWRRPLVLEMRDAWPDLAREAEVGAGPLGAVMDRLVTGAQRSAETVVTVTAGFGKRLAARGVDVPVHVPNGIAVTAAAPVTRRQREAGDGLHVLYLGNHGESQGLEVLVEAAALLRDQAQPSDPPVTVRLVGDGTRREALVALNRRLGEPAQLLPAVTGAQVRGQYAWADTCLVILRDDWPSFDWTVPSKTYELLAMDQHITPVVRGEAAEVVQQATGAQPIPARAQALADHLRALAADPESTRTCGRGRRWANRHADLHVLGTRMVETVSAAVERGRRPRPRRFGRRR
ncbi:glycosyltransferase family 4 protein [uncultured Micrococcus sp.]|uniref:glycosyltransferase family 4 protein n=1 Tax=uncultured Micrococcus sp. TaxID=114051 RepID=UPI0025933EF3|nr:glycosyltransferase family 4 protein [uncultured Micrococcus sp.]